MEMGEGPARNLAKINEVGGIVWIAGLPLPSPILGGYAMTNDIPAALDSFQAFEEPRDGVGDNPFKLGCSPTVPAALDEIEKSWRGRVPLELRQLRLHHPWRPSLVGYRVALGNKY
jgi:hypothetical protein